MKNRVCTILLFLLICTACDGKRLIEPPKPNIDPTPKPVAVGEEQEDPSYAEQWNLQKISAPRVWDQYSSSKAVKIMLIGSGIDYNHEDLRANVHINMKELKEKNPHNGSSFNNKDDDGDNLVDNFVGWDYVDNDGLAYDRYGYDTYLAGVIAATHNNGKGIKGILKKASIYPVRYINTNGQSRIPTLARALAHISDVKPDVALINLISVQLSPFPEVSRIETKAIENALNKAQKLGIPIVVGAGNIHMELGNQDGIHKIFATYENVFMVTSVDKDNKKPFLANYSYQFVHTTAPGKDVLTTAPNNTYRKVSSTSIAAAHVTAAIAMAISEHGSEKTYEDYFAALLSSKGSTEVEELNNYVAGGNTLNIEKFLQALK